MTSRTGNPSRAPEPVENPGLLYYLFNDNARNPQFIKWLVKRITTFAGAASISYAVLYGIYSLIYGAVHGIQTTIGAGLESVLYAVTTNKELAEHILKGAEYEGYLNKDTINHALGKGYGPTIISAPPAPAQPIIIPPSAPPPPPIAPQQPVIVNIPPSAPPVSPIIPPATASSSGWDYVPYVLGGIGLAGVAGTVALGIRSLLGGNGRRRSSSTRPSPPGTPQIVYVPSPQQAPLSPYQQPLYVTPSGVPITPNFIRQTSYRRRTPSSSSYHTPKRSPKKTSPLRRTVASKHKKR